MFVCYEGLLLSFCLWEQSSYRRGPYDVHMQLKVSTLYLHDMYIFYVYEEKVDYQLESIKVKLSSELL